MNRTVRETKTGYEAPRLTYQCAGCGGKKVFAELEPISRHWRIKKANKVKLCVRCAKCCKTVVLHRGSVNNRGQFKVPRFPR